MVLMALVRAVARSDYKGRHGVCWASIMVARYLEAIQCLNLIAPERLAEALEIADGRVGLRSFQEGCDPALMEIVFSVPDDQFRWFLLVLRRMSEKYKRKKSAPALQDSTLSCSSTDTQISADFH